MANDLFRAERTYAMNLRRREPVGVARRGGRGVHTAYLHNRCFFSEDPAVPRYVMDYRLSFTLGIAALRAMLT